MKKELLTIALLILLIGALSGCILEGKGTLVVQITDAPPELNIIEALVTISSVDVHLIGTGWYTVVEEPQTFDLIALQDAQELLGSVNLSAGHYTQIRLYVDSAVVNIDDIEYNLTIPSKKVQLITPFKIVNNETTTLTLDFDVHKSVYSTGNDQYKMKPTIKVIEE